MFHNEWLECRAYNMSRIQSLWGPLAKQLKQLRTTLESTMSNQNDIEIDSKDIQTVISHSNHLWSTPTISIPPFLSPYLLLIWTSDTWPSLSLYVYSPYSYSLHSFFHPPWLMSLPPPSLTYILFSILPDLWPSVLYSSPYILFLVFFFLLFWPPI